MVEEIPFRELIARVRAGDQAAAAELVRQFEPEVRRYIRLRLTDPALHRVFDSTDICQSVLANFFVRVAGGQFDLEEPSQLTRLLVTMARNKLVDYARRTSTSLSLEDLSAGQNAPLDPGPSPSAILMHEELLDKIRALLTEEERWLAEQRALGRSWIDLAASGTDSPDALRKKLSRALDRVCERLGLDRYEDE